MRSASGAARRRRRCVHVVRLGRIARRRGRAVADRHFAETAGTFVNAEGRWQSFDAAAEPVGDARPGWRVLRVLGNELELPNCEYRLARKSVRRSSSARRRACRRTTAIAAASRSLATSSAVEAADLDVPIYAVDALVRRSRAAARNGSALGSRQPRSARLGAPERGVARAVPRFARLARRRSLGVVAAGPPVRDRQCSRSSSCSFR